MRQRFEGRCPAAAQARPAEEIREYDHGRRAACRALLAGPVRASAASRMAALALVPRRAHEELGEIFDEAERLANTPALAALTELAGRATAAHVCVGGRSLEDSLRAVWTELNRRFAACESGEAGYPLELAGLGTAGRFGLTNDLSAVYLMHALERIVESTLLVATVVDPACAPEAYSVTGEPRSSTRAQVRTLLAEHLVTQQNATIDFALEDLGRTQRRDRAVVDHLQSLMLGLRAPVDPQQLVAHGHGLLSSISEAVDVEAEVTSAAAILDGSGLATTGSLGLGQAVGCLTSLAAGLVAGLPTTVVDRRGGRAGRRVSEPVDGGRRLDLARSALRVALVVAWCAEHGHVRPGVVSIDARADRPAL
ncbi:MAG: hypothetical protein ACR2KV_16685 [Solirubrobacteraceae bacterium]